MIPMLLVTEVHNMIGTIAKGAKPSWFMISSMKRNKLYSVKKEDQEVKLESLLHKIDHSSLSETAWFDLQFCES